MKKKKLPKYQYAGEDTISSNLGSPFAPKNLPSLNPPPQFIDPTSQPLNLRPPQYFTGIGDLSALFQGADLLSQGLTIGANEINTARNSRLDRLKYAKELQPKYQENYNSDGLSNVPFYTKYGGDLNSAKAKQILKDGTTNGKLLTEKQKKYFGFIAGGGKPQAAYGIALNDTGDTTPLVPYSKEFIDEYTKKYNDFYKTFNKSPLAYRKDDGYDAFFSKIKNEHPDKLVNKSGWLVTKEGIDPKDYSEFYENSKDDKPNIDKNKIATWTDNYIENQGPNVSEDARIIKNIINSKNNKPFIQFKNGGNSNNNELNETTGLPIHQYNQATVEAEGGEVYQQPDGNIVKISNNAPSHEEGGVPINNVQRVLEDTSTTRKDKYSQALKVNKDTFQKLFNIDSSRDLSHSEALEKVDDNINKQTGKIQNSLKNSLKYLDINKNDIYSKNSLNLNSEKLNDISTRGETFDTLFAHQEAIKNMLNIQNDPKAKFGKYIPKAFDGLTLGKPDVNGGITPTGKNNNDYSFTENDLNLYAKKLGLRTDNNKNFQQDLLNHVLKLPNGRKILDDSFDTYGNTVQGINNSNKNKGQYNPDQSFIDGDIKARTLYVLSQALKRTTPEQPIPSLRNLNIGVPPQSIDDGSVSSPNASDNPINTYQSTISTNRQKAFNEPLNWYDVAGPLAGLATAEGSPTNYNPTDISKIQLKRQNPLPTLQAGQRDYNAIIDQLPATGSGAANANNLFATKYALNNQVLGQYDNINNNIDNQQVMYNANASDRQSIANQQARESFEQKSLGTQEAVRQQKLKSLDELFTRTAENAKLNREGNLLLKMFPNFNQSGDYNGVQTRYSVPMGLPQNGRQTTSSVQSTEALFNNIKNNPALLKIFGQLASAQRQDIGLQNKIALKNN